MLRVGVVSYLNARPLIAGFADDPTIVLCEAPPSRIHDELLRGDIDVGLVPSVTLLRDERLTFIPGVGVGADGAVDSVLLYERKAQPQPRRIALDPHSRTSQILVRIVLEEFRGIDPAELQYEEVHPVGALSASSVHDGVLAIGDLALRMGNVAGWRCTDLAAAWKSHTGLPFVFAVWALRRGTLDERPDLVDRFARARDLGCRRIGEIARDEAARFGIDSARAAHYLGHRIKYRFDTADEDGLREFLRRARGRIQEKPCST